MLRIRLQRTGRKNLATYRIVVAEKHRAVKKKMVEVIGHYIPTRDPKVFEINQERLNYWISKGSVPTDTVASLCKKHGIKDMDKYLDDRSKKAKKKKAVPEEATAPAAPVEPAATPE